ncbi:HAD family hydrolase [Sphingomonas sp. TDK1]|uniref:HAD family hydrolase n=1 Tax=Sphingomonas sp. TDK1 TaxID=453247 RepID=UPI0007D99024|nr:HAD family phosphatase [Sphingomonas sp. TDK1]OAN61578.1 hydrolase [Sphingomonas sp. TDK1]
MGTAPHAVIFDVGNVLFPWEPRRLYERLFANEQALDAFLSQVATKEWHFQHDAGRPFAETSVELSALYPEHADKIALWGPRFGEQLGPAFPDMVTLIEDLDSAGVPLYAITNFSGEFWRAWMPQVEWLFGRFQGIVVSGDEKLVKPDPAIYALALERFGLKGPDAVFVDDMPVNVATARAFGMHGVEFIGAGAFRAELVHLGVLAG